MDIAHFTIYKIYNLQQQVEHWNGTIVITTIDRLLSFNWHLHQMIIFDRLFPLKLQIFVGCADYFLQIHIWPSI